jgi:chromosome segregation ATPase
MMSRKAKENWRCMTCRQKTSESGEDKAETLSNLSEINLKLTVLSDKYDRLVELYGGFNNNFAELNNVIAQLTSELKEKNKKIEELEHRVSVLEQKELQNDIEIVGLDVDNKTEKQVREEVINIGKQIVGETSDDKDIENCYIIKPKRENRKSKVIVKFTTKSIKNSWMKNKANLRKEEVKKNWNNTNIYINEHMTWYFRNLFWKTREKCKNYKYIWFKEGKIFVKKDQNTNAILILNEKSLESL